MRNQIWSWAELDGVEDAEDEDGNEGLLSGSLSMGIFTRWANDNAQCMA